MVPPLRLQDLKFESAQPTITLTDVLTQHVRETVQCKQTETQLIELQQWIEQYRAIAH